MPTCIYVSQISLARTAIPMLPVMEVWTLRALLTTLPEYVLRALRLALATTLPGHVPCVRVPCTAFPLPRFQRSPGHRCWPGEVDVGGFALKAKRGLGKGVPGLVGCVEAAVPYRHLAVQVVDIRYPPSRHLLA
jgi:hypothetical protein